MKTHRCLSSIVLFLMVVMLATTPVNRLAAHDPATVEANKTLVRRWMDEVMNQGQVAVADEIVSPKFVGHAPFGESNVYGQAGARALVNGMRTMLADFHVTEQAIVAEGEMVSCMTTTTGQFTQTWNGLLPNGAYIHFVGNTLFRLQEGQIVEAWFIYDTMGLMQQLTAPPAEPWRYP